jgi:muramidase (phage lysozyme)
MDKTVPASAAILLDLIGNTEVGRKPPEAYDVIYGHKQGKLPKPLTSMTLDEVVAAQALWSKHHGSSAAGRYQFMRATLRELMKELGLKGSQKLDGDLQDRLAYHLLKRRGYEQFVTGKLSLDAFANNLAKEWASFPVLTAIKGAHRQLAVGQSYYAGDGLNKALVAPAKVRATLSEALNEADRAATPSAPKPIPVSPLPPPAPSLWERFITALLGLFSRKD